MESVEDKVAKKDSVIRVFVEICKSFENGFSVRHASAAASLLAILAQLQ